MNWDRSANKLAVRAMENKGSIPGRDFTLRHHV
jgi:hypothetical protein